MGPGRCVEGMKIAFAQDSEDPALRRCRAIAHMPSIGVAACASSRQCRPHPAAGAAPPIRGVRSGGSNCCSPRQCCAGKPGAQSELRSQGGHLHRQNAEGQAYPAASACAILRSPGLQSAHRPAIAPGSIAAQAASADRAKPVQIDTTKAKTLRGSAGPAPCLRSHTSGSHGAPRPALTGGGWNPA